MRLTERLQLILNAVLTVRFVYTEAASNAAAAAVKDGKKSTTKLFLFCSAAAAAAVSVEMMRIGRLQLARVSATRSVRVHSLEARRMRRRASSISSDAMPWMRVTVGRPITEPRS